MKSLFVIAIVAVAMIGVMVPSVFAEYVEITTISGSGYNNGCQFTEEGCYSPNTVTVEIGDVVIFSNTDDTNHTFTSGVPSDDVIGTEFNTGMLAPGDYVEWMPQNIGEFSYFDMIHPWMIGTIIVQEAENRDVSVEEPNAFAQFPIQIDYVELHDKNNSLSSNFYSVDDITISGKITNYQYEKDRFTLLFQIQDLDEVTTTMGWVHLLVGQGYSTNFQFSIKEATELAAFEWDLDDAPSTYLVDGEYDITYFVWVDPENPTLLAPLLSDQFSIITKSEIHDEPVVLEKEIELVIQEKSKFKKYSDNKYNFSFEYPAEFDSHFKGVDSTPMIWKNDPHPELPWFKVWKTVKTIPEGIFATTYEFKVYSDNEMSEYSQSELVDLLENSSINLFTDMCSPENCTVAKTDSNISTNGNGAKILDIIVQTVSDYENGVTQYITNSMRITILNANNDVLMIQHITSSNDNFTHLFYEPHFTYMAKSLETQYIPKDSLKNTSTIFTAYGETALTPEQTMPEQTENNEGGGCLIATATYGSEMAPQVQQLRELRDNQLLQTESGTTFMETFNDVYYSFSPIIADYERENPYFKEAVKLAITPMISTLSLMENAESESEVLSIGISVIMLNLGMYLAVPAIVVIGIKKKF